MLGEIKKSCEHHGLNVKFQQSPEWIQMMQVRWGRLEESGEYHVWCLNDIGGGCRGCHGCRGCRGCCNYFCCC